MDSYNFKTTPYQHQIDVLKDSWDARYYALFMEMGTGKTKVAIDNMALLYEADKIDGVLVIAPKGVYDNWVRNEIPTHMPERINHFILRWTATKTQKFENQLNIVTKHPFQGLKIFVMNVEALSTRRGLRAADDFLRYNPRNMMVVDESTTIKNRKAVRTRNIIALNRNTLYRRILTGSPITRSPLDLFSQCAFLDEKALGYNSYFAFQARYAKVQKRVMGHRIFNQIVGYRRLDELSDKLTRFSRRVLKADCLDLPDKVYMRRDVDLTPDQARIYKEMKKLALARLDNGELATTASVLTQIMRLHQIVCGFLQPDSGEIQEIPSNRLSALMDIIEEVQGKAIIWASYTHDIQQIAESLRDGFGAESVATYYGATPQDQRQEIVERFQDPDSPLRFFVGQPRTGGFGITLTAANTVIYYSNNYDLEIRLQSEDRAHRIGQTNKVTYIDIVAPQTIDEKIIEALRDKINLAGEVLREEARDWLS